MKLPRFRIIHLLVLIFVIGLVLRGPVTSYSWDEPARPGEINIAVQTTRANTTELDKLERALTRWLDNHLERPNLSVSGVNTGLGNIWYHPYRQVHLDRADLGTLDTFASQCRTFLTEYIDEQGFTGWYQIKIVDDEQNVHMKITIPGD